MFNRLRCYFIMLKRANKKLCFAYDCLLYFRNLHPGYNNI